METENITQRRRQARLSDSDCLNKSLFNSTLLDTSTHSEIITGGGNLSESFIVSIQNQLKEVTTSLGSAHNEIIELNSEICTLKSKLEEKEKSIQLLKKLTTSFNQSPATSRMNTPRGRKLILNKIGSPRISPLHSSTIMKVTLPSTSKTLQNQIKATKKSETVLRQEEVINPANLTTNNTEKVYSMPEDESKIDESSRQRLGNTNGAIIKKAEVKKVLILGDEQGRNQSQLLQQKLGSLYKVQSFLKPGARMSEVTETYEKEIMNFNKNDIIILLAGVNDRNPFEFKAKLITWLNSIKNTNVIISEIPYNRNLNETKLNYELKYICSKFNNVTYIDMHYSQSVPYKHVFSRHLSGYLLKEILHISYKNAFEAYSKVSNKPILIDKETQTDFEYVLTKNNDVTSNDKAVIPDNKCNISNDEAVLNVERNISNQVLDNDEQANFFRV